MARNKLTELLAQIPQHLRELQAEAETFFAATDHQLDMKPYTQCTVAERAERIATYAELRSGLSVDARTRTVLGVLVAEPLMRSPSGKKRALAAIDRATREVKS